MRTNIVLDISKASFDKAPGFATNQRPLLAGGRWHSETRGCFSNLGKASSQAGEPGRPSSQQKGGGC